MSNTTNMKCTKNHSGSRELEICNEDFYECQGCGEYYNRHDLKLHDYLTDDQLRQINIYTTADALDPAALALNPQQSLENYRLLVTAELRRRLGNGVEVNHIDEDNTYSFKLDCCPENRDWIELEIQSVLETVYETGDFWS